METKEPLTLETVQDQDLPVLFRWLEKHLPHSWKIYGSVREKLAGRWTGISFCVLKTPTSVLAVGEGLPDDTCATTNYYTKPRTTCVFAPDNADVETLFSWPGFIDWSESFIMQAVAQANADVVVKASKEYGSNESCSVRACCCAMIAYPGDVELRLVPPDITLRALDPDLDTDYVTSTWPHTRQFADDYVRELIKSLPSVGLFDREGACLGYELGTEFGTIGLLYVRPEMRRRGLAKVITSHLAHKYFEDGLPVMATVIAKNKGSVALHENLGFRTVCQLDWILHAPQDKFTGNRYGL